ncbi:MAG: NAD(P)/FAD-dependent oxidoreductase [Nitriliruptoraceae bacterium]
MGHHSTDVCIIGAGPAGLYAAAYVGFRGLSAVLIDSLPEPGGQVMALYPEKQIRDIAGYPTVTGRDLVDACVTQAAGHDPVFLLDQVAEGFLRHEDGTFTITTSREETVACRGVIICVGLGRFTPRRLPGTESYEGRGLVYLVRDLSTMRDEDLLVVGGGDSAVDWALTFEPIARSVTLIHRREGFRAHEGPLQQLLDSRVEVLVHTEVAAIHGEEAIEAVEVVDNRTDERTTLKVTKVLAALGFHANLGPVADWPIGLEGRVLPVNRRMETTVPGVYAAGDITGYDGKLRLVSVSFGEAVVAANHLAAYLDPSQRVFPGYSSG